MQTCLKCAARGSLEIQDAEMTQKSPSAHHLTTLLGCIFTTKACIDNREKNVKQQYLLHMSPQYGELRPTSGWDRFGSLRHPSEFQRISLLAFATAATSLSGGQPNFARCFAVSYTGTLYISFQGLLPADGILRGAKFTLHPTLAFSYIGSVTARHSTSGHEPSFAAWNKEWNYATLVKGAIYIAWAAIHCASAHILVVFVYICRVTVDLAGLSVL